MTEASHAPEEQARQDADNALYDSVYGGRQRAPLSDEDEALYNHFFPSK